MTLAVESVPLAVILVGTWLQLRVAGEAFEAGSVKDMVFYPESLHKIDPLATRFTVFLSHCPSVVALGARGVGWGVTSGLYEMRNVIIFLINKQLFLPLAVFS